MIYGCSREHQKEQPTVMPYQDTTDPVKAADQLKLSDDSAREVTKEIYRIQQTQPTPPCDLLRTGPGSDGRSGDRGPGHPGG